MHFVALPALYFTQAELLKKQGQLQADVAVLSGALQRRSFFRLPSHDGSFLSAGAQVRTDAAAPHGTRRDRMFFRLE